ncbi:hypothetical protein C7M61_002575 [Candidozyma pseudohaemuli]|uniref:Diphthamide biosynthesis protein 4 n=1 Tax=Candidozyma pseudohaemuli TaxID=418784 RepID=A0A2P7YRP5_9ASCO|nr:hypothetical protein C7M61_002575 [[Candida] pseudohaemulonii]PSK38640.1 hypothetical protein C7M61_002575 [[Candida] pseudohaemulonii]
MKSYYEVLDVSPDASVEDVKAAYRKRLLESHPDKGGEGVVSIDLIKKAYEVLSVPERAKAYWEELQESYKKQGFSITGAGLDVYTLELFDELETAEGLLWSRACPRCTSEGAMQLYEEDLENGTPDGLGGFQIMVSCASCSLWITVVYEEASDEEALEAPQDD